MNEDHRPPAAAGITPAVWAGVILASLAFMACVWFGIGQPLLDAWLHR